MPYINIITAIFQNDSEITVAFPLHLLGNNSKPYEQEYHIYSSGDKIMIVFETGAKYQSILFMMSVRNVLPGSVRKSYHYNPPDFCIRGRADLLRGSIQLSCRQRFRSAVCIPT